MISDIWMILDNFLDNYSILWDLMDMICIVLKKNYYTQPLLELLFLKNNFENTYWTCSKSAQYHWKTHCKTSCFSITVVILTW